MLQEQHSLAEHKDLWGSRFELELDGRPYEERTEPWFP